MARHHLLTIEDYGDQLAAADRIHKFFKRYRVKMRLQQILADLWARQIAAAVTAQRVYRGHMAVAAYYAAVRTMVAHYAMPVAGRQNIRPLATWNACIRVWLSGLLTSTSLVSLSIT